MVEGETGPFWPSSSGFVCNDTYMCVCVIHRSWAFVRRVWSVWCQSSNVWWSGAKTCMSIQTFKLTWVSVWCTVCEQYTGDGGSLHILITVCLWRVCRPGASIWQWGRRVEASRAAGGTSRQHQLAGLHRVLQRPRFPGGPSRAVRGHQTAERHHRARHRTVSPFSKPG